MKLTAKVTTTGHSMKLTTEVTTVGHSMKLTTEVTTAGHSMKLTDLFIWITTADQARSSQQRHIFHNLRITTRHSWQN